MAHHTPQHEPRPLDLLPRGVLARTLAVSGFVAVAGVLVLVLWQVGGLDKAPDKEPVPPGAAVKNSLFTLTVTSSEAAVATGDLGESIQVGGELTSHSREPVLAGYFGDMLVATLNPGNVPVATSMSITFERAPEGYVSYVQPEVPERVLLSWPVPEGVDPDGAEGLLLAVTGAEYRPGFADQSSNWWSDDKAIETFTLPIGRG